MRIIKTLFFVLLCNSLFAQSNKTATIVYEQYENKKLIKDRIITVKCSKTNASIINSSATERFYINYRKQFTTKTGIISDKKYAVNTMFKALSQAEFTNETDTVLGYHCKKVNFDVFSNKIQVWYTKDLNYKGSPSISFAPVDGLILKYVFNGNRTVVAKSITMSDEAVDLPAEDYLKVDDPTYAAAQIKARYTTIPVFYHEQINFEHDIKNLQEDVLNQTYRYSKGNVIVKKIKLPKNRDKGMFFIQLCDWSNGDAYDRVGSVFTFSTKSDKNILNALKKGIGQFPVYSDKSKALYQGIIAKDDYSPAVELMRFFTPFGVGHFNNKRPIAGYNWCDSAVFKQDVTSLIPTDEDEIWIGVYIGNYDKGGHKVSLELDFYPEPEMTAVNKYISPLFTTVNIMEAAGQNYGKLFQDDTLNMQFEIPDSLQDLNLLFTTTGHGGWDTGDEFMPKLNQIYIDGKLVFHHIPWRTDCGTYRLLNPASGNFPDGLSSSDISRSNWCPGSLTPPFIVPLAFLTKGKHSLQLIIDQGKPEGTSFSHWCVTGVLVGNRK
ncbi:MAG: peptide-N-glycosidase F-related protein [Bacteroidetes bacterium]|nr:peptide-N-glycosidase F-related protein [Bacteroidota bacterium]